MRRRQALSMLAASFAASHPDWARAQMTTMPSVGLLHGQTPQSAAHLFAGFRDGLAESGFVEGRSVIIEQRWAHGEASRSPALAGELVSLPVAVIEVVTDCVTDCEIEAAFESAARERAGAVLIAAADAVIE